MKHELQEFFLTITRMIGVRIDKGPQETGKICPSEASQEWWVFKRDCILLLTDGA
jgi:hypothetical protein